MASLSRYVSLSATFLRPRVAQSAACQYSSLKKADNSIDAGKIAHEDPHFGKIFSKDHKMPDSLGESVGSARYELLAKFLGDNDPFEMLPVKRRASSRENPNLVPCTTHARLMGCVCNSEIYYINWMRLQKDVTLRCKCGHFFKLVDYETFQKHETEFMTNRFEKVKDMPDIQAFLKKANDDYKRLDDLFTKYEALDEKSAEAQQLLKEMHEIDSNVKQTKEDLLDKYFV